MEITRHRRGFTLIEVLIATSIFSAIGLIAITIFININNQQFRSSLENTMYEDARFMMERLSRAIRNNAIDYEEYFNRELGTCKQYGDSFGLYAAQLYNPGEMKNGETASAPSTPGDYGAFCNDGTPYLGQNCVVYKPSLDINTGMFPYPGKFAAPSAQESMASALCPSAMSYPITCDPTVDMVNKKNELYLISPDGKSKTIFARKQYTSGATPDYALSELILNGKDTNNDGVTEKWRECAGTGTFCCAPGFNCNIGGLDNLDKTKSITATTGLYDGFVPISPQRSTVSSIDFFVFPSEDPHKAFAETDPSGTFSQPTVLIVLTVKPASSEQSKFSSGAAVPEITLQTTIVSRVQTEVNSYLGYGTKSIGYAGTGNSTTGWRCP